MLRFILNKLAIAYYCNLLIINNIISIIRSGWHVVAQIIICDLCTILYLNYAQPRFDREICSAGFQVII